MTDDWNPKIRAATGETEAETEDVVDAAQYAAREWAMDESKVLNAAVELARHGLDGDEIREVLPTVCRLATEFNLPPDNAAEYLCRTLTAFNRDPSEASDIGERLSRATGETPNMKGAELFLAILYAGAAASGAGHSLSALIGMTTGLAHRGVTGAEAGEVLHEEIVRTASAEAARADGQR